MMLTAIGVESFRCIRFLATVLSQGLVQFKGVASARFTRSLGFRNAPGFWLITITDPVCTGRIPHQAPRPQGIDSAPANQAASPRARKLPGACSIEDSVAAIGLGLWFVTPAPFLLLNGDDCRSRGGNVPNPAIVWGREADGNAKVLAATLLMTASEGG